MEEELEKELLFGAPMRVRELISGELGLKPEVQRLVICNILERVEKLEASVRILEPVMANQLCVKASRRIHARVQAEREASGSYHL